MTMTRSTPRILGLRVYFNSWPGATPVWGLRRIHRGIGLFLGHRDVGITRST